MKEEERFESLSNAKPLNNLILSSISFVSVIAAFIIFVIKKGSVFTVFKPILIVQISEGLNCLSKILVYAKDRDLGETSQNKALCHIQIILSEFADFCTLSLNAFISYLLYYILEHQKDFGDWYNKYILGILLFALVMALMFFGINYKKAKIIDNFCALGADLNLVVFALYWVILIINCVYLCKCISKLNFSTKAARKTEAPKKENIDLNRDSDIRNSEDISQAEPIKEVKMNSPLRKIKRFIQRFQIFITLFIILWIIMTLQAIFDKINENKQDNKKQFFKVYDFIYIFFSGWSGVFYSFCYMFLLTNIGGNFIRRVCPCYKNSRPTIIRRVSAGSEDMIEYDEEDYEEEEEEENEGVEVRKTELANQNDNDNLEQNTT